MHNLTLNLEIRGIYSTVQYKSTTLNKYLFETNSIKPELQKIDTFLAVGNEYILTLETGTIQDWFWTLYK